MWPVLGPLASGRREDAANLVLASTLLAWQSGMGSGAPWPVGPFDILLVVSPQQTGLCPEQDRSRPQPASVSCQWSPLSVSTKPQ